MSHGCHNWWDQVQHYQLDSLEQKARQHHEQLERQLSGFQQEVIDHHKELARRVHKAEADLIVMADARAEANATVLQSEAQVQSRANEVDQCHVTMRLHAKEIEQLRSCLEELEAKVYVQVSPCSPPAHSPISQRKLPDRNF